MRPREHYVQQLEALHTEIRALGQMVIVSITRAIDALRRQDIEAARRIRADDERIDQAQAALEEHALTIMATQQPMAGDLREIVAAIEIASELERIGDYSKGIAKITIRNAEQPLVKPLVDLPRVDNARQGFFEEEHLQAVLPHLPIHARNFVEFLYLTGWRSGEAFRLQWSDVDWKLQMVWLRDSKNREPRIFPFKYHARLEQVLRDQRELVSRWERRRGQLCPSVFHWGGRPMKKLRRSWKRACGAAGLHGRLLHDFRRTAVRNLIRAGVQQAIAMKITGHKTDSIFRRYLIVDEELLAQAAGAVAELLGPGKSSTKRETT